MDVVVDPPAVAARPRGGGRDAYPGHNSDIDQADFGILQRCFSRGNQLACLDRAR